MSHVMRHSKWFCVVYLLACGSHRPNSAITTKTPLTIDPKAISLINQAFEECEHRLHTSPTISKADALILPRQPELSALVVTAPTSPATTTVGDAAVSIGFRTREDAYVFEVAAPTWAMAITLTTLPGGARGSSEVWQIEGNQSQHISWEYEVVTIQLDEQQAPDDHPIYSEQEFLKSYQCQAADIRTEYHESVEHLWTGGSAYSRRYLANIDGKKVTLSTGMDSKQFVVNTCIDDECQLSTGNVWPEREDELPALGLSRDFIPSYVIDLLQDSR